MSARAWAYIGGILALGALLSGLTLPGWAAVIAQWPTFAALTVLATLAQLYKAEAPNHQTYFATPVFLFAGLLLLHPRDGTAGSDGAGKPGLNLNNIRTLSVPVPPLPEQHRIVAKVDALMALCDRLEASLTATAGTRCRLVSALLSEALGPAEDRELEAAG